MKPYALRLTVAVVVVAAAGCGFGGRDNEGGQGGGETQPQALTREEVIERAGPGVVQVLAKGRGSGTGIVVDEAAGLVVTNAHVVQGAAAVSVRTFDGAVIPGQIRAIAPCDDLAVLQVSQLPEPVTAIGFGDSRELKAGEEVLALGYPETIDQSAEAPRLVAVSGPVSQPDTPAVVGSDLPRYPSLILHQAPLNHGNSGGPLLNSAGELVGINTLTGAGAGSGQIQGQYYSITLHHANELLPRLEAGESVSNAGWTLYPLTAELLQDLFGQDRANDIIAFLNDQQISGGMVAVSVDPGSPARVARLAAGDLILGINGQAVPSMPDVCEIVQANAGKTIEVYGLELYGENAGKYFNVEVLLP